jgi:hypothetical protein
MHIDDNGDNGGAVLHMRQLEVPGSIGSIEAIDSDSMLREYAQAVPRGEVRGVRGVRMYVRRWRVRAITTFSKS